MHDSRLEEDIEALKAIGRICAETLRKMMAAARAGMTTRELDEIGRGLLEAEGARAPRRRSYTNIRARRASACRR